MLAPTIVNLCMPTTSITPTSEMGGNPHICTDSDQAAGSNRDFVVSKDGQLGGGSYYCTVAKQYGGGSYYCVVSRNGQIGGINHNCFIS